MINTRDNSTTTTSTTKTDHPSNTSVSHTTENISEILHKKFTEYGAAAKEWMKKCVLLLPEINRRKIWATKGFSSIHEYAAKLAGMSRDKVNESLRVLEKIEDKPALKKVVEIKGVNAVKPIVTIVNAGNQEFWAEKAIQLTKNELKTYVRDYKISGLPRKAETKDPFDENLPQNALLQNAPGQNTPTRDAPAQTKKILMELSPETASRLEKLKGDGNWETLMQEFLNLREEKIESTKPEAKETASRHIPTDIKRFVLAKYNKRCAFPGCRKKYAEFHHSERFFFEGRHDPNTIIPLCSAHHSLAHKGLIRNENAKPTDWEISLTPNLNLADAMTLAHKR